MHYLGNREPFQMQFKSYSWDQKEGGVALFERDSEHFLLHPVPETLIVSCILLD